MLLGSVFTRLASEKKLILSEDTQQELTSVIETSTRDFPTLDNALNGLNRLSARQRGAV